MISVFSTGSGPDYIAHLDGQSHINLRELGWDKCKKLIESHARNIASQPTLAEAEAYVARWTIDFGGDYRDLKHLLLTETRAALLAVERRHFENSFTSC